MMSSACIAALSPHVTMMCIQHGIPTDEFFPTRAPLQIVWGETSRAVYAAHAPQATLIADALGRRQRHPVHSETPQQILLLSQTHTPIYGMNLTPWFEQLAQGLVTHAPLQILLHPGEVKMKQLYRAIPTHQIAQPPHAALQHNMPCHLVIGYASTALIDAAQAGHYVAAMAWPMPASRAARAVCQPPMMCRDVEDVLALFHRLNENASARLAHQQAQHHWLQTTFSESGALARYVE